MNDSTGCAVIFMVLICAVLMVLAGVFGAGKSEAKAERKARVEYRCWCEEWADVREAQAEYLERRGR